MKKAIIALSIMATVGTAWACRQWTTTTIYEGRIVTCMCSDCGGGPICNCF